MKDLSKQDFKKYIGFCRYHARKYFKYKSFEYEDAVLEGLYKVSNAIKKYNPNNPEGASLDSYITTSIRYGIIQYWQYIKKKKIEGISRDEYLSTYGQDISSYVEDNDMKIDVENKMKIVNEYLGDIRNNIKHFKRKKSPTKFDVINNVTNERLLYIYEEMFNNERRATEISNDIGITHQAVSTYREKLLKELRKRMLGVKQ